MDKIGHAEIRNILLKHVTRWMKFKTVLSKSNGPRVRFEKKYIQQLRCDSPADSIPLYVEEKGPTTAKAHGGTSWPPVQVKVDGLKRQREL